jgi:hypothetical protein
MQLPPPSPVFAPHVRTVRCVTAAAFALPRVHECHPSRTVQCCLCVPKSSPSRSVWLPAGSDEF